MVTEVGPALIRAVQQQLAAAAADLELMLCTLRPEAEAKSDISPALDFVFCDLW